MNRWKTKRVKLTLNSPTRVIDPAAVKRFQNNVSKRRYFRTERGRRARREAMATYRLKPWVRVYNGLLRLNTGLTVLQLKKYWDRDGASSMQQPVFNLKTKCWVSSTSTS